MRCNGAKHRFGKLLILLLSVAMGFLLVACSNSSDGDDEDFEIVISDLTFFYGTDSDGNSLASTYGLTSDSTDDDVVRVMPKADPMKIPAAKNPKVYMAFKHTWKGTYYPPDYTVMTYTMGGQTYTENKGFNHEYDNAPGFGSGHFSCSTWSLNSSTNAGKTVQCSIYLVDQNGGRSNTLSFTLHWE